MPYRSTIWLHLTFLKQLNLKCYMSFFSILFTIVTGKSNSLQYLNFIGIHSSISYPICLNDLQLAGEVQSDTKSTSDPSHLIFSCLPKSSGTNY